MDFWTQKLKTNLNTGTGYAWAGQKSVIAVEACFSIPDHFTSLDKVGAFAAIGSKIKSIQKIEN